MHLDHAVGIYLEDLTLKVLENFRQYSERKYANIDGNK